MSQDLKHNWNPNSTFEAIPLECPPINETARSIWQGDIQSLSRAITIGESHLKEHQDWVADLLDVLIIKESSSTRIAITGSPGVGKSTFIESLGNHIVQLGIKLAVLAVDPSSKISGGSILGDKTRMSGLASHALAYIRPSAIGRASGGISHSIPESILLCEAAGFDIIIIETVGVGQSETTIYDMVDSFVLLIDPGAGDELQGIKRGIIELADLIFITKGEQSPELASQSKKDYEAGIHIINTASKEWSPKVLIHDSLSEGYAQSAWNNISEHINFTLNNGVKIKNRSEQALIWFEQLLYTRIQQKLMEDSNYHSLIGQSKNKISKNDISIPGAVKEIIRNRFS